MDRRPSSDPATADFRLLFESAPGLYLVLTPDWTIVAVSDAYLRATMTRREDILGRGIFEVFPDNPNDPGATGTSNLRASLERVVAHRRPDAMAVQKYDIRKPQSEGGGFEVRHWSPVNSPVLDGDGSLRYIIHRVEDVTEFVRLKALESEQHRLADDLRTHAGRMEAEVYRRAQQIQDANRELREWKDELERRVEARTAELAKSNDALRRSEDLLRQSQKLEAIGRLAGGVAHDFNNLLTAILGYGQFLQQRLGSGHPGFEDAEEILKAAERAATLTRQLLAFSRQQVLEPRVLDLNVVVTNLDKMLRRLIGEDVDLLTAPAADLGSVRADPGQLEQVLVNLAVNARDAMPEGGKLTIETANVEVDEDFARSHGEMRPGPYVMLAVSDTGSGMNPEIVGKIFEPFFTTKGLGRGTGLGLSTVHGIVTQSGGHIEVYSAPGHGATFKLYFPRVDAPAERPPEQRTIERRLGTETILLVEDEDVIRRVVVGALRMNGYTVLEASDGGRGVEICEGEADIDLLVTDVILPVMNGPDLVKRVHAMRPGLPVLFISGYTDRALIHRNQRERGTEFLQKPFRPDDLVRRVREILDGRRDRGAA
jgi:signal transduction histidine kinase/ActR/RegA family two-component response regulator